MKLGVAVYEAGRVCGAYFFLVEGENVVDVAQKEHNAGHCLYVRVQIGGLWVGVLGKAEERKRFRNTSFGPEEIEVFPRVFRQKQTLGLSSFDNRRGEELYGSFDNHIAAKRPKDTALVTKMIRQALE